jgi:hypothetical protein
MSHPGGRRFRAHCSRRRPSRYRLGMAATKRTQAQDKDVISLLADRGEEALRRLVDTPRRMAVDVRDGVDARLHDVARKLRAIDPLDDRVTALERRLDSLEKPAKKASRRTPTRAKQTAARRAGTTAAADPKDAEHDRGPSGEAAANNAERDDTLAGA